MGDVLFVWAAVSNMFGARMRPTLARRLVSIVCSVFDQTCFNRLATHFNISMFGHETMIDDVWAPNIYRLDRPLVILSKSALFSRHACRTKRKRDYS